jgi:hypothetical protein
VEQAFAPPGLFLRSVSLDTLAYVPYLFEQ